MIFKPDRILKEFENKYFRNQYSGVSLVPYHHYKIMNFKTCKKIEKYVKNLLIISQL